MKHFPLLLLSLLSLNLYAQEVDIKKQSVFINGVEELTRDKCNISIEGSTCVYTSTKTNLPVFSIHILHYVEIGKATMDINFMDFDFKCRSTMTFKNLFLNLYKLGVIDSNGKADPVKAQSFARLFNELKDDEDDD